jgi:hypothetical protein
MNGRQGRFLCARVSVSQSGSAQPSPLFLAGSTVEELCELISVPLRVEHALRAFARAQPEEAHGIERSLKFRFLVAQEFDRLVQDGVPVGEPSEIEALELKGQAIAIACDAVCNF